MLIYRYLSSILILQTSLTLVHVWGQISLNRLQNGEVIVHRHPQDPQPLYRLPTLIVPGSIEYETTVDGVVIKFSTSMELTRTPAKPGSSASQVRGTSSASHEHRIRPTRVHEGVIRVFSDSNSIISPFDDPGSPIPMSSLPSSISLSESSSPSPSISHSSSESVTVSSFELLNFSHAPTPVLPVSPSSPTSSPDHLYASFFPLPFEESAFEASRSKPKSSLPSLILSPSSPSPSPSSSGSAAQHWKTLASPENPWKRLFSQQIHASAPSSISRSGQETSSSGSSVPSSRDAQRVRMNRLKLKVKNTDKLYDICLKDVCLRGELPQAVLLIGSQMLSSPTPASGISPVPTTSVTPPANSFPESLDVKAQLEDVDLLKDQAPDVKGFKDETYEDEKSGTKLSSNYDFPLGNDWREVQDLQTVENQRIRNQIKLNIDVPSFRSRNITSSEASLSSSSLLSSSPPSSSRSGVREARMKSGSNSLPALAFLSLPAPAPGSSHVSVNVAGSWDGSESGYHASAEALILVPSMTAVRMSAASHSTVTAESAGDAMAAAAAGGWNHKLRNYTRNTTSSRAARDPLLPIMSSVSLYDPSNVPMDGSITTEATPVLPHEAAFHLHPSSDDRLRMMMMEGRITISQTYSRPMGSTSRITVWKHRNSHEDRPISFTITENFFINQVITAFRTMPSAIMTHAVMNSDWKPKKMITSSSTIASAYMAFTDMNPDYFPAISLPPYIPMIDPSAFSLVVYDDGSDHRGNGNREGTLEKADAPAESRQVNVNLRRNPLSRIRSSKAPAPILPIPSVSVKTQLRSQLQTKILAIIYNQDSTKFKTITHTKYFSTRITVTRTTAPSIEVPFTRYRRSG